MIVLNLLIKTGEVKETINMDYQLLCIIIEESK